MNERIAKLANESGFDVDKTGTFGNYSEMHRLEKFAELIVQECMKVAVNKDSGYMHPANVAGYMAAGRSTAAQMIKEHFGVEE
jgi:hypothetical protein